MNPIVLLVVTLAIPAVCYVGAAVGFWQINRPGMTIAYAGYAVSCVGFVMDTLGVTW